MHSHDIAPAILSAETGVGGASAWKQVCAIVKNVSFITHSFDSVTTEAELHSFTHSICCGSLKSIRSIYGMNA